jgi:hypothetical protein
VKSWSLMPPTIAENQISRIRLKPRLLTDSCSEPHYERNHQGLGNRLILEKEPCAEKRGAVHCRQRLGGMLNYYYRQAA